MARVVVDLRPLVRLERVLDGQRVQPQLVGQPGEVGGVGREEVDPHDRVLVREPFGDVGDREVLVGQHAVAVGAGSHVTHADK